MTSIALVEDFDELMDDSAESDGQRLNSVALLDADVVTPDFMIAGYLPEHITVLAGEGGAYKSTIMMHLACAMACGASPFGALPATAPRKVLIISGEDSLDHLQNRAAAFVTGHGWNADLVRRNLFAVALADVRLDVATDQARIRGELHHHGATLLCCDPLADLIDGDESSNTDARPTARFLRSLVAEGIATIIAHHVTKPADGKQKLHRIRGAGAWVNAARAAFWIEAPAQGEITMECLKLSAACRPPQLDLRLQVAGDQSNTAAWIAATLAAPGQGGDWRVIDRRELTPSARKALETLAKGEEDEALSFSVWQKRSGLPDSSLTDALPVLKALGYAQAAPAGTHAGRPKYAYSITLPGRAALASMSRIDATPATPEPSHSNTGRVGPANTGTPIGVQLVADAREVERNTGAAGPGLENDVPIGDPD